MNRIEKLKEIAKELNVEATIKQVGDIILANVNGNTFKVKGFASFQAKCVKYASMDSEPQRIDLTNRLSKIENAAIQSLI